MSHAQHHVTAAFLPLLDSALLLVAAERGFAAHEGIELSLVKETSWASIRDRMAVGHFDVAHMLAPMPIASNLGTTSLARPHRMFACKQAPTRGLRAPCLCVVAAR